MVAKLLIASSVWKLSSCLSSSHHGSGKLLDLTSVDAAEAKECLSSSHHGSGKLLDLASVDAAEAKERGSFCIDGSIPTFYYSRGSTDKWVINVHAPGGMCTSEEECHDKLPLHEEVPNMKVPILLSLFENDGSHLVYMSSCDFGLYLGDRPEPVEHHGTTLYFRGARVMKHIIDTLSSKGSMREVLFIGGSGGGQSIMIGADHLRSVMPQTVEKFGIAPLNGWYSLLAPDEYKEVFELMGMKSNVNQGCVKQLGDHDAYLCLQPAKVYDHNQHDMFITQLFDHTFQFHFDLSTSRAWGCCMGTCETCGTCDGHAVDLMNTYLTNLTRLFEASPKYKQKGQGLFLSTCTLHAFFLGDMFYKWKNHDTTAGDSIVRWWKSPSKSSEWNLPCELGYQEVQCEPTCRG